MGTGIGAMKMEKCANIILQEIINFQTTYNNDILKKIIFCVRGEKNYLIATKVLKRLNQKVETLHATSKSNVK